jgi:hypothetical protein
MKNSSFIIYIAIAYLITFSGCKRDTCPDIVTQHDTLNFTPSELSKVPYTGFDTLYFLNKLGDTCIVRGTGKKWGYETQTEASGIGCGPEKITYYPSCTINFQPVKNDLEFKLTMSRKEWSIIIEWPSHQKWFYLPFFNTGIPRPESPDYIESIAINNKQYTVVRQGLGYSLNAVVADSTYRILYNIDHGLLQIQDLNFENYTLTQRQ